METAADSRPDLERPTECVIAVGFTDRGIAILVHAITRQIGNVPARPRCDTFLGQTVEQWKP